MRRHICCSNLVHSPLSLCSKLMVGIRLKFFLLASVACFPTASLVQAVRGEEGLTESHREGTAHGDVRKLTKYVKQRNGIYRSQTLESEPIDVIDVDVIEAIQLRGGPLTKGKNKSTKEAKENKKEASKESQASSLTDTDIYAYNVDVEATTVERAVPKFALFYELDGARPETIDPRYYEELFVITDQFMNEVFHNAFVESPADYRYTDVKMHLSHDSIRLDWDVRPVFGIPGEVPTLPMVFDHVRGAFQGTNLELYLDRLQTDAERANPFKNSKSVTMVNLVPGDVAENAYEGRSEKEEHRRSVVMMLFSWFITMISLGICVVGGLLFIQYARERRSAAAMEELNGTQPNKQTQNEAKYLGTDDDTMKYLASIRAKYSTDEDDTSIEDDTDYLDEIPLEDVEQNHVGELGLSSRALQRSGDVARTKDANDILSLLDSFDAAAAAGGGGGGGGSGGGGGGGGGEPEQTAAAPAQASLKLNLPDHKTPEKDSPTSPIMTVEEIEEALQAMHKPPRDNCSTDVNLDSCEVVGENEDHALHDGAALADTSESQHDCEETEAEIPANRSILERMDDVFPEEERPKVPKQPRSSAAPPAIKTGDSTILSSNKKGINYLTLDSFDTVEDLRAD